MKLADRVTKLEEHKHVFTQAAANHAIRTAKRLEVLETAVLAIQKQWEEKRLAEKHKEAEELKVMKLIQQLMLHDLQCDRCTDGGF